MIAELRRAFEPPVVEDATLRAALVAWFRLHAENWKRQADEYWLYGAENAAENARARASVCEQFANDLEK